MDREWLMLTGGYNHMWPQTVLIGCFFYAAVARPDRIRSLVEFRIAGLFLAAAVIAPTLLHVFIAFLQPGVGGGFQLLRQEMMTMMAMLIPPFLLMMSVILGLDSVIPRGRGSFSQLPSRTSHEEMPTRREDP